MKRFFILGLFFLFISCFPYLYYQREKVLLENVDVQETLCISEVELKEGGFDSILTLWALRDQIITEKDAERIKEQYFSYIDSINTEFGIWHLGWAISNFYRWGDEKVKSVLEDAYLDVKKRQEKLRQFKKIADEHINGEKIYCGDIHDLGRYYARTHIVVKDNKDYVQSFKDYLDFKQKEKKEKFDNNEWLLKCNELKNRIN